MKSLMKMILITSILSLNCWADTGAKADEASESPTPGVDISALKADMVNSGLIDRNTEVKSLKLKFQGMSFLRLTMVVNNMRFFCSFTGWDKTQPRRIDLCYQVDNNLEDAIAREESGQSVARVVKGQVPLSPEAVAAGAYEFLTVARMPRIEEIAKKLLQLNNIPYKSVEAEDGWKSILVRLNNKLGMLCNQDELDNDNPVKVELSICNLVNLDSVKKREATGQAIDYRTLTDVQK